MELSEKERIDISIPIVESMIKISKENGFLTDVSAYGASVYIDLENRKESYVELSGKKYYPYKEVSDEK